MLTQILSLLLQAKMIYAYIRVSTDKQTVENQRFEIEKFARIRELNIDKWIAETVSGTKSAKKRKLGPLIKKLKKGQKLDIQCFQAFKIIIAVFIPRRIYPVHIVIIKADRMRRQTMR